MTRTTLLEKLQQGITSLGQDAGAHPCTAYLEYLSLLEKWNSAYNLTAVRDPQEMLSHHLLDSIAVLPFIHGSTCLDVGSGAGLPGLVLALARPEQDWHLLDSNRKKIRFLNQAVLELDLANVQVVNARIEDYQPTIRFSTIISRALGPAPAFYRQVASILQEQGRVIAMKGRRPEQELISLRDAGIHNELHVLSVPGLDKQRHLVVIHAD